MQSSNNNPKKIKTELSEIIPLLKKFANVRETEMCAKYLINKLVNLNYLTWHEFQDLKEKINKFSEDQGFSQINIGGVNFGALLKRTEYAVYDKNIVFIHLIAEMPNVLRNLKEICYYDNPYKNYTSWEQFGYESKFGFHANIGEDRSINGRFRYDYEEDRGTGRKVDNCVIFLTPAELANPPIQLIPEGLSVPLLSPAQNPLHMVRGSGYMFTRNSAVQLGMVVGVNLTKNEINVLKEYCKNNGLMYVGECDITKEQNVRDMMSLLIELSYLHKNNQEDPEYLKELNKLIANKAEITPLFVRKYEDKFDSYTQGAAMGMFEGRLPREVSTLIAENLDRKTGGRMARTRRSAADLARSSESNQKDQKKKIPGK